MRTRLLFFIILALSLFLFFFRSGDRPFRNPDEGRYAEISREMAVSGDWVEPRLYGLDYLRKPPLFYWLIAGSFKAFGHGEWQARLVPALFGVLGVTLVFFFAARIFSPTSAFFASLALLSNFWYVQVGRYLVIDMVFSFFVVASLLFFYLGCHEARYKKAYFFLFFISLALSFLAKGMLGFAIPGCILFVYLSLTKKWGQVREMGVFRGLAAMALVMGAWLVPVSRREPEFWNVFFFREHLQRLLSKNFEHQEEWFFYPALFFLFCLPWALFAGPIRSAWRAKDKAAQADAYRFCLLSAVLPVFLLSFSRSKLATYILPVMPFAALGIGHAWAVWSQEKNTLARQRIFYSLAAAMMVLSMVAVLVVESVNGEYTNKRFAEALSPRLQANDEVYIYDHPGPFYDLSFYLDRPVKLVGLQGEFEGAFPDEETAQASVTQARFKSMVLEGTRLFCIIRRSDFMSLDTAILARARIIKEDARKVLFETGGIR